MKGMWHFGHGKGEMRRGKKKEPGVRKKEGGKE
jgi:hypothetical protein